MEDSTKSKGMDTNEYCSKSGGRRGEDNATHHYVPSGSVLKCRYCGKTAGGKS